MNFDIALRHEGFVNNNSNTSVVENGTFFSNFTYFPHLGYTRTSELVDPNVRRKHELPALSGAALGAAATGLADIVERIPLVGDGGEPLRRELENFRDAARGIALPAVSGSEGRAALAVALSIEERIRSHVPHPGAATA